MKRNHVLLIGIVLISLGLVFSQPVGRAQAASFVVDSNGDEGDSNPGDGVCSTASGVCTLRAAIEETNELPGPNTITVPAMVISLHSELKVMDHVGDDSVIIVGAGRDETILDGSDETRVFYFEARSGDHSISNLTIRNARNQYSSADSGEKRNGGGIFSEAGLKLENVRVTNSKAYQGGGVYSQHAWGGNTPVLTLRNVILDHNQATASEMGYGGGGLFNGSILDADQVSITDNTAVSQGGGYYNNSYQKATLLNFEISRNIAMNAGGIDNDLGDIDMLHGKLEANETSCCVAGYNGTGGAGIFNNDGTMYLEDVAIKDNITRSPGGFGAGIYNFKYMTLKNVSITGNRAAYGAGIDNGWWDGQYPNLMTLINVTLSNNIGVSTPPVDAEGAAIHNRQVGVVKIYNSTITENYAKVAGGIRNRAAKESFVLQNTILAGNKDDYGVTDCRGGMTSGGYNIVGNPVGNPSINPTFTCTYSSSSTDQISVNPNLGPLAGEDIFYHPLLTGSPAIDTGTTQDCPETDIMGNSRPAGKSCDVGAFEKLAPMRGDIKLFTPLLARGRR